MCAHPVAGVGRRRNLAPESCPNPDACEDTALIRELRRASVSVVKYIHAYRESVLDLAPCATSWDAWITKSHSYVESLIVGPHPAPAGIVEKLSESVPFSRYLAVIRVWAADLDPIDILLDTTSTERNLQCLAVLATTEARPVTEEMVALLADQFECAAITLT